MKRLAPEMIRFNLKKMNWDIYSLNNDGTENELINDSKENGKLNKDPRDFFENNKTYKVKVPLDTLPEGNNSIKIYAVGYSKIYQSLASGGDKRDHNSQGIQDLPDTACRSCRPGLVYIIYFSI